MRSHGARDATDPPIPRLTLGQPVASRDVANFDAGALETARFVEEVDLDALETAGRSEPRPMEYRLTKEGRAVADALWRDAPSELRTVISASMAPRPGYDSSLGES